MKDLFILKSKEEKLQEDLSSLLSYYKDLEQETYHLFKQKLLTDSFGFYLHYNSLIDRPLNDILEDYFIVNNSHKKRKREELVGNIVFPDEIFFISLVIDNQTVPLGQGYLSDFKFNVNYILKDGKFLNLLKNPLIFIKVLLVEPGEDRLVWENQEYINDSEKYFCNIIYKNFYENYLKSNKVLGYNFAKARSVFFNHLSDNQFNLNQIDKLLKCPYDFGIKDIIELREFISLFWMLEFSNETVKFAAHEASIVQNKKLYWNLKKIQYNLHCFSELRSKFTQFLKITKIIILKLYK